MKVLIWQWGRFGAGPRYALELATALREHCGIETRVSLAEGAEILTDPSLRDANDWPMLTVQKPLDLVRSVPRILRRLSNITEQLRRFPPDAALSTMAGYWDGFLLSRLKHARVPFATTIHDATMHPGDTIPLVDFMQKRHLRSCRAVVTLTDYVAERLRQRDFLGDLPQHTIPLPAFEFRDLALAPPPPLAFPGGGPLRLLLAGRLKAYKGLELLREALDCVPAERITVRIAGAIDDPEALAPFKARPNVALEPGWLSDAAFIRHIDWADVLVLPYTEASQSGVIPIAFLRGRPVITTPVGGLPEQVRNGRDGLIAGSVTGAAVGAAIAKLIETPDLVSALAAGARRSAIEEIGWGALAPRFAAVLEQVARAR